MSVLPSSAVLATVEPESVEKIVPPTIATSDRRPGMRAISRSTASIARQLAGWADAIEVVEPPEVRAELVRIGEALVRRHVTAPVPS